MLQTEADRLHLPTLINGRELQYSRQVVLWLSRYEDTIFYGSCLIKRMTVSSDSLALSARDCPLHGSPDALYIVPHATNRSASL